MTVDKSDWIRKGHKQILHYRHYCPECGCDKGYKQGIQPRKCTSCATKGRPAWNKGLKETRPEVVEKMSVAKRGKEPHNKGRPMTEEQRIKLSCVNRGIDVDQFDDFVSKSRGTIAGEISLQCLEKADYTCDICGVRGCELNAHHKDSWKHFPEKRLDLDNLVCLCRKCHRKFHKMYGNGKFIPNTREQYEDFKKSEQGS